MPSDVVGLAGVELPVNHGPDLCVYLLAALGAGGGDIGLEKFRDWLVGDVSSASATSASGCTCCDAALVDGLNMSTLAPRLVVCCVGDMTL
jgi:hypothetical protein